MLCSASCYNHGMSDRIVEVLEIACNPERPDLESWMEKIAAIVGEFRGVLMGHTGNWFSVGFPDEATAWEACKAIHASGDYLAGPMPLDDEDV